MLSAVSLLSPNATPMLAESASWWPATWAPRPSEARIRSQAELTSGGWTSSSSSANSSPPSRATVSLCRTQLAQPLGDVDQHRVTGGVAEPVVDRLEAVEVDEQQRDAGAAPARHLQRVLDPVEEQAAVGQVR